MNTVIEWSKAWLRSESSAVMPARTDETRSPEMIALRESKADAQIHLMGTLCRWDASMRDGQGGWEPYKHAADLGKVPEPSNRAARRRAYALSTKPADRRKAAAEKRSARMALLRSGT